MYICKEKINITRERNSVRLWIRMSAYCELKRDWGKRREIGLVWFYGVSTIEGYFMLNPVYTYISNIWFVNILCWLHFLNEPELIFFALLCITNNLIKNQSFVYTQLNDQTVLFLTIHCSMSES